MLNDFAAQARNLLEEIANHAFYEGVEIDPNEDYATDGWEPSIDGALSVLLALHEAALRQAEAAAGEDAYRRGYDTGYLAAIRRDRSHSDPHRLKKLTHGLTYGQVRMIKMQLSRYNAAPEELAENYKVPIEVIGQIRDGTLYATIPAKGSDIDHDEWAIKNLYLSTIGKKWEDISAYERTVLTSFASELVALRLSELRSERQAGTENN